MFGSPITRVASRRPLVIAGLVVVAFTVAMLPASTHRLGPTVSFVPAMLAVVACFDVLSMYLLVGEYHDSGDVRLLAMSWAYLWSLVTMAAYALAFPGVISPHPPLELTPSMAPWFYVAWHAGFPILLGAAWAPWPRGWTRVSTPRRRHRTSALGLAVATLVSGGTVALLVSTASHLPVLIRGLDTSRMTALTAPFALPLVSASVVSAAYGTRQRNGAERWSSIAALVCLCDLTLTYVSRYRYSAGWYAGRSLTLVASGAVLVAMLAAFRRIKAQAEHDATVDPLTGLANRRSGERALDAMAARVRRSGAPLGVVAFDVDQFKSINDRYGHEGGDRVLAAVGKFLGRALRLGDVAARVGGDEFLVLLADTDAHGASVVADQIRLGVANLRITGLTEAVTVSLGAGCLSRQDESAEALLRRVDGALYAAKLAGRDRTVMATPDAEPSLLVS